jgi:hypothetical protein
VPLARAEPGGVAHRADKVQGRDNSDAEPLPGPPSQPMHVVTATLPGSRPGGRHGH